MHCRRFGRTNEIRRKIERGQCIRRQRVLSIWVVVNEQISDNIMIDRSQFGIKRKARLRPKTKNGNSTQDAIAFVRSTTTVFPTVNINDGSIGYGDVNSQGAFK